MNGGRGKDGNGAILRYWKHKQRHAGACRRSLWTHAINGKQHKQRMLEMPAGSRVDTFSTLRRMYEARAKGKWFCWTGVECL